MGKKIRYKLLKGSLLEPLLQFTNKMEIRVNPIADPRGYAIGQHMHLQSIRTKPKFKGENFESNLEYDLNSASSYAIMYFVNGWKHGYKLRDTTITDIQEHLKLINEFVAFQRMLQGHEDEYEDEDA